MAVLAIADRHFAIGEYFSNVAKRKNAEIATLANASFVVFCF